LVLFKSEIIISSTSQSTNTVPLPVGSDGCDKLSLTLSEEHKLQQC